MLPQIYAATLSQDLWSVIDHLYTIFKRKSIFYLSSTVVEHLCLHSLKGCVRHVHPTRVEDVSGRLLHHLIRIQFYNCKYIFLKCKFIYATVPFLGWLGCGWLSGAKTMPDIDDLSLGLSTWFGQKKPIYLLMDAWSVTCCLHSHVKVLPMGTRNQATFFLYTCTQTMLEKLLNPFLNHLNCDTMVRISRGLLWYRNEDI